MFRCLNDSSGRVKSGVERVSVPVLKSTFRRLQLPAILGMSLMCLGCVQEMANQPRVDVMEPNPVFQEIPETREPVPGTIARGRNIEVNAFTTGKDGNELVTKIPAPVTEELIKRGQSRYGIFCQHCHGPAGNGDGMVVQRGFPAPPSYHSERVRSLSDGKIFQSITEGFGRMPALGKRISLEDRWAIVAYVRALQLSQNSHLEALPAQATTTAPAEEKSH
ncbi:c-type cytochrome [Planctomicrobium sp. SH664]|uniref:c-type cytochrome n=1 Tax=Planctomicrobium sp. SH664 TaxID=3448125 RepID=UPI003F5C1911